MKRKILPAILAEDIDMFKSLIKVLLAVSFTASSVAALSTAFIVAPMATAEAQAGVLDFIPVPTGAYINVGRKYYYGDLNDPSKIVPGVAWQLNANGTVLLKGYGGTPRAIIDLVNKVFFRPIRVE
jgi:hypothetical protein